VSKLVIEDVVNQGHGLHGIHHMVVGVVVWKGCLGNTR
jgi:hypothetical protein